MSLTEESTTDSKVVDIPGKGAPKRAPKAPVVATAPAQPQEKMYLISEKAINAILNAVGELKGLDWKTINPIMAFIQQNVTPVPPSSATE
jgi:hypothetical protein